MSLKPRDCRVLVIDDNVDAAELMATLLHMEGFSAGFAFTGRTGLDMAVAVLPQAVCIDIEISDVPYEELIQAIKDLNFPHQVFMIGMTSWDKVHHPTPKVLLEFDTIYVKPVEIHALTRQIRRHCYG